MGIVDQAIEYGVSIGRIADDLVPDRYRQLAGDDRRTPAVALFEDFEQVVAGVGIERLKSPVVEDQQLDAAELGQDLGMTAIAARQRQAREQLGHALVKHRAVITAGLVAQRVDRR